MNEALLKQKKDLHRPLEQLGNLQLATTAATPLRNRFHE